MTDQVREFYKALADNYHFLFADWRQSVRRQSEILDNLLRRFLNDSAKTVLDCTCGIGTQAIGLAARGYTVTATDLSTEEIERAKVETAHFNVDITFGVADVRQLESQVAGTFDTVLSFDNAIAHFQTLDDLALAFRNMAAKIAPGGVLLVSLRDYDQVVHDKPRSTLPVVADRDFGRSIVFLVWDWTDDDKSYTLSHFTVKQAGDTWETVCATSQLRAWQRAEVNAALVTTDLTEKHWLMPDESGFYQPILVARKPA
jgi:SAM-dependent methyltransferase